MNVGGELLIPGYYTTRFTFNEQLGVYCGISKDSSSIVQPVPGIEGRSPGVPARKLIRAQVSLPTVRSYGWKY